MILLTNNHLFLFQILDKQKVPLKASNLQLSEQAISMKREKVED